MNTIQRKNLPSVPHYYEGDNKQCFRYNDSIYKNESIYIWGYLQTEKYFKDYKQEIISLFKIVYFLFIID